MEEEKKQSGLSSINIDELEFIVKIKDGGKLKATAIMKYRNLKIKGFRIMDSEHVDEAIGKKIWIEPPSYNFMGKYHKMFFLEPEEKLEKGKQNEEWDKFKKVLYEDYKKADKEYYNEKLGIKDNEDEIDIENIKLD
jgi:hypothetical protein